MYPKRWLNPIQGSQESRPSFLRRTRAEGLRFVKEEEFSFESRTPANDRLSAPASISCRSRRILRSQEPHNNETHAHASEQRKPTPPARDHPSPSPPRPASRSAPSGELRHGIFVLPEYCLHCDVWVWKREDTNNTTPTPASTTNATPDFENFSICSKLNSSSESVITSRAEWVWGLVNSNAYRGWVACFGPARL